MFRNRVLILMAAVAMAMASAFVVRAALATAAGNGDRSDYGLGQSELAQVAAGPDLSDYAFRHPIGAEGIRELAQASARPDLSDYAFRHPIRAEGIRANDLSDFGLRHPDWSFIGPGPTEARRLASSGGEGAGMNEEDFGLRHPLPFWVVQTEAAGNLDDYGLRHPGPIQAGKP